MHNMKKLILSVFIFTFGFAMATHAQQVNTLLTKQLPEAPGKEIEVIIVNYAPGAVDAIHRHDAHAVVYVLDGEVEMQVRGVHGRGDVSLPQFIDSVVCVGSYRRGDTLWDIAYRRLQNTNDLRPLRSSAFVIWG